MSTQMKTLKVKATPCFCYEWEKKQLKKRVSQEKRGYVYSNDFLGCYRTYEELKLKSISQLVHALNSYYRTYEESTDVLIQQARSNFNHGLSTRYSLRLFLDWEQWFRKANNCKLLWSEEVSQD